MTPDPGARVHELKTWTAPFAAMRDGRKRFEFRRDDRGYRVGDELRLREWDERASMYTGRELRVAVEYLLRGPAFGLPEGYCVMSVRAVDTPDPGAIDLDAVERRALAVDGKIGIDGTDGDAWHRSGCEAAITESALDVPALLAAVRALREQLAEVTLERDEARRRDRERPDLEGLIGDVEPFLASGAGDESIDLNMGDFARMHKRVEAAIETIGARVPTYDEINAERDHLTRERDRLADTMRIRDAVIDNMKASLRARGARADAAEQTAEQLAAEALIRGDAYGAAIKRAEAAESQLTAARELAEASIAALDAADEAVRWMTHTGTVTLDMAPECECLRSGPDTCDCGSDAARFAYQRAARAARDRFARAMGVR